jgi:hypothetical protein
VTDYKLLPEEAFDDLPEDPNEQFLKLTRVAENNYSALIASGSISDSGSLRRQFIDQITMIAGELNVSGLLRVGGGPVTLGEFISFQNSLVTVKSTIHFRRSRRKSESVQLGVVAKAHIEIEIERLRSLVNASDLPDDKKKRIAAKLDELIEELHKKRLGFAKVLGIAAIIAGIVGGTASGLANGPEALERVGIILHWVGREIDAEEAEQLRLSGPLKALPPPSDEMSRDVAAQTADNQDGDDNALES